MKAKVNKVNIEITRGSILSLTAAAIVTVTDPNLHVDPALAVKAGPLVQAQTAQIGWCDIGAAVITDAGSMKNTQKIIHVVGPRWGEESVRGKLALAVWRCLALAEENGLKSIVLPPISVGTLGYPLENCAKIMMQQIVDFTFEKLKSLKTVVICVDDTPRALEVFEAEFRLQLDELQDTGEGQVVRV